MLILTIKTDTQQAEVGLFEDHTQLAYEQWQAHRELSDTLHTKIVDVLMSANNRLHELQGITVFKGPGSFTGLRIGISVANALSYGLDVPIVGSESKAWIEAGVARLLDGKNERLVVPEYGSAPHITAPKH